MQFTTLSLFTFAATALAMPAILVERQLPVCSSGSAQCCATDVLNLADLDCAPPSVTPANATQLISTCESIGQQAKCCLLPILGQALICSDVNPN